MPRKSASNNENIKDRPARRMTKKNYNENDGIMSDSLSSEEGETVAVQKSGLKRAATPDDVPEVCDFSMEMSRLLQGFSTDINKTLQSKRKRVQQYTEESIRSTSKKVLEVSKGQSIERQNVCSEYRKEMGKLLEQEEAAVQKMTEIEEKVQKTLQQLQKQLNVLAAEKVQRVQAMKTMTDSFLKGMDELEMHHVEQYARVHNDMRKEMSLLQKKLLLDTQQQEMLNVRKQLHNMLT